MLQTAASKRTDRAEPPNSKDDGEDARAAIEVLPLVTASPAILFLDRASVAAARMLPPVSKARPAIKLLDVPDDLLIEVPDVDLKDEDDTGQFSLDGAKLVQIVEPLPASGGMFPGYSQSNINEPSIAFVPPSSRGSGRLVVGFNDIVNRFFGCAYLGWATSDDGRTWADHDGVSRVMDGEFIVPTTAPMSESFPWRGDPVMTAVGDGKVAYVSMASTGSGGGAQDLIAVTVSLDRGSHFTVTSVIYQSTANERVDQPDATYCEETEMLWVAWCTLDRDTRTTVEGRPIIRPERYRLFVRGGRVLPNGRIDWQAERSVNIGGVALRGRGVRIQARPISRNGLHRVMLVYQTNAYPGAASGEVYLFVQSVDDGATWQSLSLIDYTSTLPFLIPIQTGTGIPLSHLHSRRPSFVFDPSSQTAVVASPRGRARGRGIEVVVKRARLFSSPEARLRWNLEFRSGGDEGDWHFFPEIARGHHASSAVGLVWYEIVSPERRGAVCPSGAGDDGLDQVAVFASGSFGPVALSAVSPRVSERWSPKVRISSTCFTPGSRLDPRPSCSARDEIPLGDYMGLCGVDNSSQFGREPRSGEAVASFVAAWTSQDPIDSGVARIAVQPFVLREEVIDDLVRGLIAGST